MKETILFCLLLAGVNFEQSYEWCLDSLYSENYVTKCEAIDYVSAFEPEGTTEVLVELIDQQQPYLQIRFLNTLYNLGYEDVSTLAHELISRADEFANDPEHPRDPLDAKVDATTILVYKGDFSTIGYVFEKLNKGEITKYERSAFLLLYDIIKNAPFPDYKKEAKNILLNVLNNESEDIRYYSLLYLAELFGAEMNNELVDKFVNSYDLPTKMMALKHLCINNYSELNSLLKQQLELEEEMSLRIGIADSLLFRFGEPSDLKAVIDHQPNDPDETAKSLMGYSINEFIPPKPDSLNCYELCEKLISYTGELFQYGWIRNEETRDYYVQQLAEVNKSIEITGEINDACVIIKDQIIPQVERDLKDELISEEGYKFLHYYTIYIKEDIEEEFGACH